MRRAICYSAAFLTVLLGPVAPAQPPLDEGSRKALQPAPVSGVLDESHFFSRGSGALESISADLTKLAKEHGFKIYLTVEPVLIASSPAELAAEYRQAWLPGGDGLVVAFESDSHRLGIGQDISGNASDPAAPARVPSFETAEILNKVTSSVDSGLPPEQYLKTLIGGLTEEFGLYFTKRDTPPPASRSIKTVLVIVGILALLGLGAIGIGSMIRHSSMAGPRSFRFPKVDRPERLAAPCGAGVSSRSFAVKTGGRV